MQTTTAYVYKWTHLPTMKWYVGSRTRKDCHPNDGYICSSKSIKSIIIENKQEWKREIIATGTPLAMYELETEILQLFNARKDTRSYNGHNNDSKYFPVNEGSDNPMFGKTHSEAARKKMSLAGRGKKRSEDARKNISNSHIGVSNGPHTAETKAKMSASMKGRTSPKKGIKIISDKKYYHNGVISKKFVPGTESSGFIPGRIIANQQLGVSELNGTNYKGNRYARCNQTIAR